MRHIRNKQRGFTVVEGLLIILILVVLGFIGYYVWHNHQDTVKTAPSSITKQPTNEGATNTQSSSEKTVVAHASVDVTLTYPADWTVTHPNGDYSTHITGPGGDVFVSVQGLAGLGGRCDSSNTGTFQTVQAEPLNDPKLTLVTYTTDDKYPVASEVVPSTDATQFKVGASACDGYLSNILDSQFFGKDTASDPNIVNTSVSIESKSLTATLDAGKTPTGQDIQAFLQSDDYKTAVSIVKSLQY